MNNKTYVYLRFTSSHTFVSWLVSTWTGQWPSHVEFVIGNGKYLGSDIDVGVAEVDDEYYKDSKFKRVKYYKILVSKTEHDLVYIYAREQLGKDYDTIALIGNIFRRNWQETKNWFCSELVAWALEKAGNSVIRNRTNRVTPGDLLLSPLLIPCIKEDLSF